MNISSIKCSLQAALLGAITNNLRALNITLNNSLIVLYFYYETSPSGKEKELSEIVLSELISDFTEMNIKIVREVLPSNIKNLL